MPERIFIIEFATSDAARQWYRSEDYRAALEAPAVRLARPRIFDRGVRDFGCDPDSRPRCRQRMTRSAVFRAN